MFLFYIYDVSFMIFNMWYMYDVKCIFMDFNPAFNLQYIYIYVFIFSNDFVVTDKW